MIDISEEDSEEGQEHIWWRGNCEMHAVKFEGTAKAGCHWFDREGVGECGCARK